jgi:hypothetical protein
MKETKELDDMSIDNFCVVMKEKMDKSREKGRGGWSNPEECTLDILWNMLRFHVDKGDPVDIANISMMIYYRQQLELVRYTRSEGLDNAY